MDVHIPQTYKIGSILWDDTNLKLCANFLQYIGCDEQFEQANARLWMESIRIKSPASGLDGCMLHSQVPSLHSCVSHL